MRLKYLAWIFVLSFVVSSLTGCARTKEAARGILGISTKNLEDLRPEAIKETIYADLDSCYANSLEILQENKSYVYTQDRKKALIAVYLSETDTTPVGIFFTRIGDRNTLVEISSPSIYAKESVATELLSKLLISLAK